VAAPEARAVRGRDGDLARRPGRPDRSREGDLGDAQDRPRRRIRNPLGGFKPGNAANAGVEILEELREVNRIVSEKATPEDAAAMREWLLEAAQAAANAAKEGGFMGFHAERVSEGEQRMLDSLNEALAAPPA
jgi:broad specificity phosphatase PhoE